MPVIGSGASQGQQPTSVATETSEQLITVGAGLSVSSTPVRLIGMGRVSIAVTQTAGAVGSSIDLEVRQRQVFRLLETFLALAIGVPMFVTREFAGAETRVTLNNPGGAPVTFQVNISTMAT